MEKRIKHWRFLPCLFALGGTRRQTSMMCCPYIFLCGTWMFELVRNMHIPYTHTPSWTYPILTHHPFHTDHYILLWNGTFVRYMLANRVKTLWLLNNSCHTALWFSSKVIHLLSIFFFCFINDSASFTWWSQKINVAWSPCWNSSMIKLPCVSHWLAVSSGDSQWETGWTCLFFFCPLFALTEKWKWAWSIQSYFRYTKPECRILLIKVNHK